MTQEKAATNDPLLQCLVHLTAHYGQAQSAESLTSNLAYTDKGMDIPLFQQAAIGARLRTKLDKRELKSITSELCPVVLVLKGNEAVVLHDITHDGKAHVYRPSDNKKRTLNVETLEAEYTGYTLLIHQFNERRTQERHWFWSIVRNNRPIYRKVAIAAVLINLFGLVSPLFIMNVYDRVIPNNAFETGWVLAIAALTIFGFDFVIRTLRGYFIDLAGRKIDVIVGRRIYDHLLNMKLAHKPQSSGAFANMIREFEGIKEFCTSATLTAIIDLPFALLFIFVIYLLAGNIALILLAIMIIVTIIGYALQFPLKKLVHEAMQSAEAKHGLLIETINGLETIKLTRADGQMRSKYDGYLGDSASVSQTSRFFSAMAVNFATLFQQSASIIVVLFGMYMVEDGTLTMGALIAAVIMGGKAIAPIGQIAALVTKFHTVKGSLNTLNTLMSCPVERPTGKKFLNRPDLKGDIALDRVSFAYPNDQRKILDGVSLSIKAGEKVGIIGRIGSGKSTLTKIIAGLYDATEGDVFVDGTDTRQIDPADLRKSIGYVAQETILFRGSIRDNIVTGNPQASDEEILEAAKKSGVHDFVARHPMGYDAPVGERGDGLSGGQKQCVSLARAFVTNPKIILADEPTNDMDIQAEAQFIEHMQGLSKDKTLILITHRQSLLKLVDRLIIIDQGKLVADGPRDKVIAAINGEGGSSDE